MKEKFNVTDEQLDIKLQELFVLSNNDKEFIPKVLARHKLLDFIGDLYLTNSSIKGKIKINKPGHLLNGKVAKLLANLAEV